MNDGNNGMFEPQIMPKGNDNNNGNNFNPNNNAVSQDELRSLDQQMGNMPGPNDGFNNMNNQNNFNNGNMPNNNPMGFNNMNNQNNFNNNMNPMGNNMNPQPNYAPMKPAGSNNTMLYTIIGIAALVVIGAVVYFVFLSGDKKVLSCELKTTGDESKIEITYKNKKATKGTYYEKVDGSLFTDEQFEQLKNYDLCPEINSQAGGVLKNCKQKIEGKSIVITAEFDISKAKEDVNDIDEGKKSLEGNGMTCTIK